MHPASTLQLPPMPRAMAERGVHVLCAASRYARNDTALIMESVVVDLGAYMRRAREVWGYRKIVIAGWSGGGSLALFHQSQAEKPTITHTPAGDPCNIMTAGLIPADGFIFQAAHVSRAVVLSDWIDPSVLDEDDPDRRDAELDLYHPANKPPYSAQFLLRYRAAQMARIRRRTAWVRDLHERLRNKGGLEMERGFVTHRTMAEPCFLDTTIDPNDRTTERPNDRTTERLALASWAIQRLSTPGQSARRGSRLCVRGCHSGRRTTPTHTARNAPPTSWCRCWQSSTAPMTPCRNPIQGESTPPAPAQTRPWSCLQGATQYFVGQPELLAQAAQTCIGWMQERRLLE
jgi:hypothetical protein